MSDVRYLDGIGCHLIRKVTKAEILATPHVGDMAGDNPGFCAQPDDTEFTLWEPIPGDMERDVDRGMVRLVYREPFVYLTYEFLNEMWPGWREPLAAAIS